MAIVVVDAMSRSIKGAVIMECWKLGIEIEDLPDNQLELTCAYDDKLDKLLDKYNLPVLHKELLKETHE